MALLIIVFALIVASSRESTCVILYNQDGVDWNQFIAGLQTVIPAISVVLLSNPDLDYVAYTDALKDCSRRFTNLVCQVPNDSASRILAAHFGVIITVSADPILLPPAVTANIVMAEQNYFNVMKSVLKGPIGKSLVVSDKTCRVPSGCAQVHGEINDVPRLIGSRQLDTIFVSSPTLSSMSSLAAIHAAYPGAQLCAATDEDEVVQVLTCQVKPNRHGAGVLAAGILRLGKRYAGPQSLCVDPIVLKPAIKVVDAEVTTLRKLRALCT